MANITFNNREVRDFYHHSLAPHFEAARTAAFPDEQIGKIAEAILSAHTIFPEASEDIKLLEGMQDNLIHELAKPRLMKDLPPVGITNQSGNDCWASALMQLLANAPGLRRSRTLLPLTDLFERYRKAQIQETVCEIDSQQMRTISKDRGILGNRGNQEDPIDVLRD